MDELSFLLAPFATSLILAGIHTYLGLHVVERGVIFVDLALAQIAALGASVGILYGADLHSRGSYWFSLGFTFLGAVIFSNVRSRRARIPTEAIIGICYAVASAATVLVMNRSGAEAEHLRHMLVGNLLFVTWSEVIEAALIYSVIGIFHYLFRKSFLAISSGTTQDRVQGLPVRLWDLLFYASFGFVVTSSVAIAGVLLVFCYLIVPTVGSMLFARTIRARLMIGWTMGTVVSALGVLASLKLDLPTGATIVCMFGAVLATMAVAKVLFWR